MIIAAHTPIGVEPAGSPMGWGSSAHGSEKTLIAKLHTYPNLILWIAGHLHRNPVTAFKSPDADPVVEDGSPAATSRTYAVAAQQIFKNALGLEPTWSYNAELVAQLSPEMRAELNR
jgi:hypothetical protein